MYVYIYTYMYMHVRCTCVYIYTYILYIYTYYIYIHTYYIYIYLHIHIIHIYIYTYIDYVDTTFNPQQVKRLFVRQAFELSGACAGVLGHRHWSVRPERRREFEGTIPVGFWEFELSISSRFCEYHLMYPIRMGT